MRPDQVLSDAIERLRSDHWVDMRGNVGLRKPVFDAIVLQLESALSVGDWSNNLGLFERESQMSRFWVGSAILSRFWNLE